MSTDSLSTTVATIDRGVLQTTEVVARVHRIQDVMRTLMKEDVHYGQIPGTPKKTLYKPGAELLLMTFRIAASPSNIEDLSTKDEVRYRVTVRGTNQLNGEIVGEMCGECSSNEEKYKWRKPVCDEEWQEADPEHRREKWARSQNGNYKVKQIRTSPPDVANTILKMAVKRAMIATTLVALGASDIFAQDLEDLAEELRESIVGEGTPAAGPKKEVQRASANGQPKPASNGGGLVTEARKVKDVRVFGKEKNNYALVLDGDKNEYTTKDSAVAYELEQFKGTDHKIRVRYEDNDWNGKVYHNIKSFAIADAEVPVGAATSGGSMTSDDIPFGR